VFVIIKKKILPFILQELKNIHSNESQDLLAGFRKSQQLKMCRYCEPFNGTNNIKVFYWAFLPCLNW